MGELARVPYAPARWPVSVWIVCGLTLLLVTTYVAALIGMFTNPGLFRQRVAEMTWTDQLERELPILLLTGGLLLFLLVLRLHRRRVLSVFI